MSSTGKTVIWLYVVFTLVFANQVPPQVSSSTMGALTCGGLKNKLQMKNISSKIFASDDHLDICVNNSTTCCTQQMEKQLHKLSGEALQRIITAKTDLIKKIFSEGLTTFNGFFEDLITDSEKQMHKTFMSIYKAAYVNNSHITKALYSKLRKYYSDGSLPPKEIVKIFFQDILKKMFLLLNPTAKVDIDCVGNNMETVKPFGKVPRTVSVNVERSFNAARSFVYGFTTGKMVVARLTDLSLTEKCLKSVTRMTQCSHCHGQNNLKPCAGYCKSVYAHCFASLMELEHVWDEYLTEMQNIAVKLEGSFDIEGVTRELPYDISEGIMNYQQESATASPKLIKACQTKRSGRSLTSSDNDFFLENNDRVKRNTKKAIKRNGKPTLNSLTKIYKDHFKRLNKFWAKLSETMCDQTVVANNVTDKYCWNGAKIVNNTKSVYQQLAVNPVKNGQTQQDIQIQSKKLKAAIKILQAAKSGDPSIMIPIKPTEKYGSGSGSGSGSGDGEPDDLVFTVQSTIDPSINVIGHPTVHECKLNCVDNNNVDLEESISGRGSENVASASVFLLTVTSLLHVILMKR